MTGPSGLMAAMEDIASAVATDTVRCYTDPAKALNNRPCLLVAPPTLDYTGGTMTGPNVRFRVIALSSYVAGVLDAVAELDDLVAAADQALTVERAEPIQYPLAPDGSRVAAYLITTTDYPLST